MRLALSLFLLGAYHLSAADPKPVLVVLERNPWLMVIGSDSPVFALYNDGTVICQRAKPTSEEPYVTFAVSNSSDTMKAIIPFDIRKMADHYELSSATDQTTTLIWTNKKKVEIYGDWRKPLGLSTASDSALKAITERERGMWEKLPKELRQALQTIDEMRNHDGRKWFPKKIEVMFWPYDYAPDQSINWPNDWPGLSDPTTKTRSRESYSVYLPCKLYGDLRSFLATRKEKGAVLIDGKKMTTDFRFPFPNEHEWMK